MRLYRLRWMRRLVMPILARINPGDIQIRHHWTGDTLLLHSYKHKGYWYHGKSREHSTMDRLAKLIKPESTVFDIGGHIGYLTLYFHHLVGQGKVHVFEPAPNNLAYLERNLRGKANVVIVEKGAGAETGRRRMYLEGLTGQNNSFVKEYREFESNRRRAFSQEETSSAEVDIIRLDQYVEDEDVAPDFIKVDVEGFESEVLDGSRRILSTVKPILMVEMTRQVEEVFDLLLDHGYLGFDPELNPIRTGSEARLNMFFLHTEAHREQLFELCSRG